MREANFYETYKGDEKVSSLVTQLPWTHNMIILGHSKRAEEREFYLRLAVQQRRSTRELTRQMDTALFERAVLDPPKVSSVMRELHPEAEMDFRDTCVVEFLGLPDRHLEADLHRNILRNMQRFMAELGAGSRGNEVSRGNDVKLHEFHALTDMIAMNALECK